MKGVIALFSGAVAIERSFVGYTFEAFQSEFGKHDSSRRQTFMDNLNFIKEHNSNPSKTYWLSVNQFADMTNVEFRNMTRGRKEKMFEGEAQPYKLSAKANALPDRIDYRETNMVSPVKDQGGCGSCWAFSAAQTFESHLAIQTKTAIQKLSPQQIVSCAPNPDQCGGTGGCEGSTQPLAFAYTKTGGLTTEALYPYSGKTGTCKTGIQPVAYNGGYTVLPTNDYNALMDAVANVGPVAISIAAGGSAFQFYGGGVLSNCNDYVMDHAVQLVGYGTDAGKDYYLVRNSWGSWGEKGYMRVRRYGDGKEPCGVDKKPGDGDACKGDTAPRTYCGECGILSASSYPTDFTTVQPAPSPPPPAPPPAPTPSPSPSPTPGPDCVDIEEPSYCNFVLAQDFCSLIGEDCENTCDCCEDPSACGEGDATLRTSIRERMGVTV